MKRILVAGIGNLFFGDDAFGISAVHALKEQVLPKGVVVVDFGIRSHDLAYSIADGYDAVILVDATPRNQPPGSLYLIEPDLNHLDTLENESVNPHGMNPVAALQMARALGGEFNHLFLVACEPEDLGGEEGKMGLSPTVSAVVPEAVKMIESLIERLLEEDPEESFAGKGR